MKVSDTPGEVSFGGAANSRAGRVWKVGTLTYSFNGLSTLFGWLLWGDFALAVRDRAIQGMVQLLFKKFGASDMFSGVLISSLPSALGLFLGPVIGYKSDRLRTRWGRRIPFLVVTTPIMVFALAGLAFSPQLGTLLRSTVGTPALGVASSVLIFLGVFWFVFEVAVVISTGVFGALVNDVVPQEVLGRFFGLFRIVGLIVGIVFFSNLMGQVEDHFSLIFLSVAAIYGIGFALMCAKVKEGQYPPLPDAAEKPTPVVAIKTYFREGFGHSLYLWYFGSSILSNMASTPFGIYAIVFAKNVSMDMGAYGKCLALTYGISLFFSYPLGYLADRFHPVRITYAIVACFTVAMIVSFFLVHDVRTFSIALIVHGVLTGSFNTASASLGLRLLPRAKFAEISSAGGILYCIVGILLAPTVGLMLDHENHDYRYTFLAGFMVGALALVCLTVLNLKFNALGGLTHYHPPGSDIGDDPRLDLRKRLR